MNVLTSQIIVKDKDNRENSCSSIIQSVGTVGILEPLVVYKSTTESKKAGEDRYVLVAGHRRYKSALHFGLIVVPVNVIQKKMAVEARALENIDRANLDPLDESLEIKNLHDKGYTQEEIGLIMGIPVSRVVRRSKLSNLGKKARKLFKEGELSLAAAEELALVEEERQKAILKRCNKDFSVKTIKQSRWVEEGFPVCRAPQEFQSEPGCDGVPCKDCPHNPASDQVLFTTDDVGTCTNLECWVGKLMAISERRSVPIIESNRSDLVAMEKILQEKGAKITKRTEVGWVTAYDNGGQEYLLASGESVFEHVEGRKADLSPKEKKLEKLYNKYTDARKDYAENVCKLHYDIVRRLTSQLEKDSATDIYSLYRKTCGEVAKAWLRDVTWGISDWMENYTDRESVNQLSYEAAIAVASCKAHKIVGPQEYLPKWNLEEYVVFQRGEELNFMTEICGEELPSAEAVKNALDAMEDICRQWNEVTGAKAPQESPEESQQQNEAGEETDA